MAAGNSDGDIHMLKYAGGQKGPTLGLLVRHDDAEREYAYDAGAEMAFQLAPQEGWIVVSMRDDWKTVFAGHPQGGMSMNDCAGSATGSESHQTKGGSSFSRLPEKVFARAADRAAMGRPGAAGARASPFHTRARLPLARAPLARRVRSHPREGWSSSIRRLLDIAVSVPRTQCRRAFLAPSGSRGLFLVEPADAQGGRLVFRECFDDVGRVEQALLRQG